MAGGACWPRFFGSAQSRLAYAGGGGRCCARGAIKLTTKATFSLIARRPALPNARPNGNWQAGNLLGGAGPMAKIMGFVLASAALGLSGIPGAPVARANAAEQAGGQQTQPSPPRKEYGVFTNLVKIMIEQYSQENADYFRTHVPPICITPYDQWTVKDFVILRAKYPKFYKDFTFMYRLVAVNQDVLSPAGKQFAQDAVNAMTRLSGDGDWKRYARMIGEAEKFTGPSYYDRC